MIAFLRRWILPIAMIIGAVGHRYIGLLSPLSPILIFCMLLLTFNKVSPNQLHIKPHHIYLLLFETIGAVIAFFAIKNFDSVAAQATMVCIICPTATAAAVVTDKLKGSVASVTTYTLLCNITIAILVPLLFPLIAPLSNTTTFIEAFWTIIKKVAPLLIVPFIIAQFIQHITPHFSQKLSSISGLAFYMWALALTIAMGTTVKALIESTVAIHTIILVASGALIACATQFYFGKLIGRKYNDEIAAGQSLGQKNTILAIWMCHTYLNPISALGPGIYIIFQNTFNSIQLYIEEKKKSNQTSA